MWNSKIRNWLSLENYLPLVVFLLPAYLVKFVVFGIPTNLLEALIFLALIWWLAEEKSFQKFFRLKMPDRKIIIPICLMIAGLLASLIVNKNYLIGLGIIKGWFLFPLLFLAIAYNYLPVGRIPNIFRALYFSAFFVALISLAYKFLGLVTFDGRLQGFFNSPNYLAMYLAPAVIIATQYQSLNIKPQNQNSKQKTILLITLVVILAALCFTYSYAAWISVAIALLIMFVFSQKLSGKYMVIAFLIIISAFFLLRNTPKFQDLASLNERSSLASRIMIWESAGKMLQNNWLWGIGPGNFQEKYLAYQKYFPPYLEWAVPHPHSLYLAFWLYGGLIGITSFIILVAAWFRGVLKEEKLLSVVVIGIMSYILIHGFFDTTYFKNDLAMVFWLNFLALKKRP